MDEFKFTFCHIAEPSSSSSLCVWQVCEVILPNSRLQISSSLIVRDSPYMIQGAQRLISNPAKVLESSRNSLLTHLNHLNCKTGQETGDLWSLQRSTLGGALHLCSFTRSAKQHSINKTPSFFLHPLHTHTHKHTLRFDLCLCLHH